MAVSMRWKLRTAAAVAALAFGACGGESKAKEEDEKDSGPVTRSDAGGGGAGDAGFQVPIAKLGDGVAGKPCMADGDCAGTDTSCLFGACSGTCESNSNCGSGGTCVKAVRGAYGQYGACAKVCTAKSDCSGEQDCREGIETGSIFGDLVGAVQDAGISLGDAGLDIDVTNLPKTCGPSLNTVDLPDGLVSTPCTGAAQCMPGECATDVNLLLTFPNGYCTGNCLTDDQCGAGAVCYKDPLTAVAKGAGRCLATCSGTGTSTCKHGLVCRTSQILLENTPRSYCLPAVPDAGVPSSDAGGASDAGVDASIGDGG